VVFFHLFSSKDYRCASLRLAKGKLLPALACGEERGESPACLTSAGLGQEYGVWSVFQTASHRAERRSL
jgi:hypothetical protein